VWVQTLYLGACSAFLLLSLPPEVGRFELREANLLLAFLVVQLGTVAYLTGAFASSELSVEGEKGLPDLALSAFGAVEIAVGKLISSVGYAVYLVALALPLTVLAAGLRAAPLSTTVWAAILTLAVATALGVWGAWLGGRFTSDFTRSFLYWLVLAGVFVGTARLPAPWNAANPVRLLDQAVRNGWSWTFALATAGYLAAAVAGVMAIASYLTVMRTGAEDA
jgi:hypothetical protein